MAYSTPKNFTVPVVAVKVIAVTKSPLLPTAPEKVAPAELVRIRLPILDAMLPLTFTAPLLYKVKLDTALAPV